MLRLIRIYLFILLISVSLIFGGLFSASYLYEPISEIGQKCPFNEMPKYQLAKKLSTSNLRMDCVSFTRLFSNYPIIKMKIGIYTHYVVIFGEYNNDWIICEANLHLDKKISCRRVNKDNKQIKEIIYP